MRLGSSRGIALISVLWITGLLAVIAASFASSTRTEARLARNLVANAKAEALADGGVHRAVLGLLNPDPATVWRADRTVYALALGEGEVQIEIEDEDGKIDLNGAPPELLAASSARSAWRRARPRRSRPGSPTTATRTARPSRSAPRIRTTSTPGARRRAADRPFATESELLNVLGVSQVLYEEVRPLRHRLFRRRGRRSDARAAGRAGGAAGDDARAGRGAARGGARHRPYLAIEDQGALDDLEFYLLPTRDLVFTVRALARTPMAGPSCARP